MEGIDERAFLQTVAEFNAAVQGEGAFDPTVLDGVRTLGLQIDKSNWALPFVKPPFEAYPVTCGITFSYGGLKINTNAEVIHQDGNPIPGLFAAGELAGGIHYFNYAGGSGLTAGALFGRHAGTNGVKHARC
jgi:tricarballylate dehydrogenase